MCTFRASAVIFNNIFLLTINKKELTYIKIYYKYLVITYRRQWLRVMTVQLQGFVVRIIHQAVVQ